jgi:hypothetical protein
LAFLDLCTHGLRPFGQAQGKLWAAFFRRFAATARAKIFSDGRLVVGILRLKSRSKKFTDQTAKSFIRNNLGATDRQGSR